MLDTIDVKAVKERLQRLEDGKCEYTGLLDEQARCERELQLSKNLLPNLYRPFGLAVFMGYTQGELPKVEALNPLLKMHTRIQQLEAEFNSLRPTADAGFVQKAKAKTKQAILKLKIKSLEGSLQTLEANVGQQIIEEDKTATVECGSTSNVLVQLTELHGATKQAEDTLGKAVEELDAGRERLTQSVPLNQIEGVSTFDIAIKACQRQLGEEGDKHFVMQESVESDVISQVEPKEAKPVVDLVSDPPTAAPQNDAKILVGSRPSFRSVIKRLIFMVAIPVGLIAFLVEAFGVSVRHLHLVWGVLPLLGIYFLVTFGSVWCFASGLICTVRKQRGFVIIICLLFCGGLYLYPPVLYKNMALEEIKEKPVETKSDSENFYEAIQGIYSSYKEGYQYGNEHRPRWSLGNNDGAYWIVCKRTLAGQVAIVVLLGFLIGLVVFPNEGSPLDSQRLVQIYSWVTRFLRVKKNAFLVIVVIALTAWWFLRPENYSPLAINTEVDQVFTHTELAFHLKDNTKSTNESVDDKIIQVTFEIKNRGPRSLYGEFYSLSPKKQYGDIYLSFDTAREHLEHMFINKHDSVYLQDSTNYYIIRDRFYWTSNGVPFVSDSYLESTADPDYKSGSGSYAKGRFLLRMIGICSLHGTTMDGERYVKLKRCRIIKVEAINDPL